MLLLSGQRIRKISPVGEKKFMLG